LWSISSFFINLLPIYFLHNSLYAELIVSTTTIFLLNQVITFGLSDSILKYGNSVLIIAFILLLVNSFIANLFLSYEIVLSSLGLSSMIIVRNSFIKYKIEYKLIKFTLLVVIIRIITAYLILINDFILEEYLILLFLIPSILICFFGLFIIRFPFDSLDFKLIIKKEIIFFALTTVLSRFLYNYSTRISIFILNSQKSYDELKIFGFLLSFLGIYSLLNQSIRSVLIGQVSSDINKAKNTYSELINNFKIFIPINIMISVILFFIVYYGFTWESLEYIRINFSVISLIFLFFLLFGIIIYVGLFNVFLRTINRIDIEILVNIFRLIIIYLSSFYLKGFQFLYMYLIVLFLGEIILAAISSKFLFKWKK
jgi:hypothetical protein